MLPVPPELSGGMLPLPNAMPGTGTPNSNDVEDGYLAVDKLRRQYTDYLGAKQNEIDEQKLSRQYYHGAQWTAEEIAVLRRRKQPVITDNIIFRKIDAVVGLVERIKQQPKAYSRTPQNSEGSDLASAAIRYVLDTNDWHSKHPRCSRIGAIDGIAGIEYDLQPGDQGDPELAFHIVYPDSFFYDVRSYDEGFTDARYLGVGKWMDVEQAKELVPDLADELDGLMDAGTDLTSLPDRDKVNWLNSTTKQIRLVDHWYIHRGEWKWCLYTGQLMLMQGVSPFIDEKGKTFPKYRMFSAAVDHDGDRYGFVRNLKSSQDETNHWRSKALHIANSKRLIATKGAVDDPEKARAEWARPDGFIEVNPGGEITPDQTSPFDLKAMLEFEKSARASIENFGPNPALIGQGLEDSSGRAINLLQQAGMSELGPYLSAFRNWKIRVYRDIWNIIQRHWKSERWIRVTDDQNLAQYLQLNAMQLDQFGRPQLVNALGSLDVDIILDEGPDTINMQADAYATVQSLGPQFAQSFPEIAIELSPLPADTKKRILDKLKEKQSQPPPPDPKVQAMAAQAQIKQQESVADMQLKAQQAIQDAQLERERVAAQIQLEREKAEAQLQIEAMKAAHGVKVERMKHQETMEMAREKMRREDAREPA